MIKTLLRSIILTMFAIVSAIAYKAYGIEAINALLLVMPSKLIVPTLRKFGADVGSDVQIHSPLMIHNATDVRGEHYANLHIASNCYIGRDVMFDLKGRIQFEEYVTVSMRCTLITHSDLGFRPEELAVFSPSQGEIVLQRGAYLGASVTVLQGVTIGERSVIGASSLVIRDIPSDVVAVGIPARSVKKRV